MMSLRWGVLHKKTSWTFQGEANGNKWHNCRWLIPPIANSAACARARPCRPGRAGVSVAGPGYCQTVPVSVAREVQLKRRKMPFSDWAIRLVSAETLRLQNWPGLPGDYWWVVNLVAKPYDLKQMAAYGTIQSGESCQIVHMALELGPARQYSRIWGPGRGLALQGIRILKLQHKEAKPPGCLQLKEGGWVGAISWDNASKLDVIITICLKRILYSKRYVWNRTKVEREESHSLEEVSFFLEEVEEPHSMADGRRFHWFALNIEIFARFIRSCYFLQFIHTSTETDEF